MKYRPPSQNSFDGRFFRFSKLSIDDYERNMQITDYHAKYYAHELTKRCSSDSLEKLAASLADAQVDLNPHQVDAALFAFRSPFSSGATLAGEGAGQEAQYQAPHSIEAQDEIDSRKEGLIEGVEARLQQLISTSELFAIRWRVV